MLWKLLLLPCLLASALHITGLGSSFAAGPGVSQNYARILGTKLNAKVSDLSASGSTLAGISGQLARIASDSDIVTITSGGNDLGYMAGLMADSLRGGLYTQISEDELASLYGKVLDQIHAKAPNATVYVIEYLTILGPDVRPGVDVPFNAARVEKNRGVAATLLKATQKAATSKPFAKIIHSASKSVSHGVGSQQPWINSNRALSDGMAWHPRQAGMNAIAELLYEAIKTK